MELAADLGRAVTDFTVTGPHMDCICGRELIRLDRHTGEVLMRKAVFEKDGFSRKLTACGGQLFIYDFCTLLAFRQEDYSPLGSWRLGEDLSSDICGMAADEDTVYCSIRNGRLIAVNRQSYLMRERRVSGSSMWSVKVYGGRLVCGTVDGRLLLLDKRTLAAEKELELGKKNIGSLFIDGGTLYAACQDGRLFKISLESFQPVSVVRNAHKKMFRLAGTHGRTLITVSHPCSQIALWDVDTLEKLEVLEVPLRLSGKAYIEGDDLYISSRNILGIGVIRLK